MSKVAAAWPGYIRTEDRERGRGRKNRRQRMIKRSTKS